MNYAYLDLVLARVRAAVSAAEALKRISHQGLKGQLRELVIRDLFRPLLPADVGLGTGEIISTKNQHSRQQDVVMFDRSILPPMLLEGNTGVFPIESVLYTVEVKSTLNAAELKESHASASELLDFPYLPGVYDEFDKELHHEVKKVVSTILAFDTDLSPSGKTETQRYDELCKSEKPVIRAICVVGKGYWWWTPNGWKAWPISYDLGEVVGFVAGVMNTYRKIAATRKEPRMGRYVTDL